MQKQSTTEMNSLSTCVNKLVGDGYTTNFKVDEQGLVAVEEGKHYKPDQVHIKNFFRLKVLVIRQIIRFFMQLN
jgi:hypothetical protein